MIFRSRTLANLAVAGKGCGFAAAKMACNNAAYRAFGIVSCPHCLT
jgi:hypothetical protein